MVRTGDGEVQSSIIASAMHGNKLSDNEQNQHFRLAPGAKDEAKRVVDEGIQAIKEKMLALITSRQSQPQPHAASVHSMRRFRSARFVMNLCRVRISAAFQSKTARWCTRA